MKKMFFRILISNIVPAVLLLGGAGLVLAGSALSDVAFAAGVAVLALGFLFEKKMTFEVYRKLRRKAVG